MLGLHGKVDRFFSLSLFTCYFFGDAVLNWPICCVGSMQYFSIADCFRYDVERNFRCCRANCCPSSHGTDHRSDLSNCRPPDGNLANASSTFSPYTNRTYHGICTPGASHFEHAEMNVTEKKTLISLIVYDAISCFSDRLECSCTLYDRGHIL